MITRSKKSRNEEDLVNDIYPNLNCRLTRSMRKSIKNGKNKDNFSFYNFRPMLAYRFYNPNISFEDKDINDYKIYGGDSGKRVDNKWLFKKEKTIYYNNPKGWFISEKIDGVRAIWNGKKFYSRNGNIIYAPEWFKKAMPEGRILDGELNFGREGFQKINKITSYKMPLNKDWLKVKYDVFDIPEPILINDKFSKRVKIYEKVVEKCKLKWNKLEFCGEIRKPKNCPIRSSLQLEVKNFRNAYSFYKDIIKKGGEGVMLKNPNSKYEYKRSWNLLKWKPNLDAEAVIVGYNSGTNKFKNRLGNFRVKLINSKTKLIENDKEFSLSGKLSHKLRNSYLFKNGNIIKEPGRELNYPLIGDIVTFSYMKLTDSGIPRQPVFERIKF